MASLETEAARIFLEAVEDHERGQWADFVRQASAGDPVLVQRVNALLQAHDQSNPMLEAGRLLATADIPRPSERPGTMIGPYKLLEQIGEGGMGVVFMAEQMQPLRRKVALKVIKPGMDSKQVIARFEAERQALALMDHPNIARVIDAGATESGRPYFVMELVKGIPITEYCDQARLTTRQRLQLFQRVCLAVQHAHQKGIIHRDLKPGNVLVTLHDGEPVPKVIDFGIAKATGQQLTEKTMFTRFAQMVGTPLYMSPEQAALSATDVDTRSDVYALGVVLYELLTGTTPFESDTLKKAGLDEMRRMIREEEPPTPSRRLSTLSAKACSTISERQGVDESRRLGQVLRGELDWIVMKALEKDRDRRYESASAFAADVQRYLSDEPVEACPPSAGYRLRKFTRRNRRALVTAGVIAASLVAATAVSSWKAVEAEADRYRAKSAELQAKTDQERATAAERLAATEAAIAKAVNEFLQVDLLGQVASAPPPDREFNGNPYLTVKEALDRAAARIGQRFQDQPLVEAAIRAAIGIGYEGVYERQLAVPHLEPAVALRRAHLGPDHPDTLGSMESLAVAYSWVGRHPDSISLRQHILENRKARLGPDHAETRACVAGLAKAYCYAGQLETSAQLWEQVLERHRTIDGPAHPATLGAMNELAWVYGLMDRFDESLALFDKYFKLRKVVFGPGDRFAWGSTWFVQVCQWAGKFDQADGPLREAIAQARQDNGSVDERNELANKLGCLAVNLLLQRRYDEAELLAREAVAKSQIGDTKHFYWVSALGAVLVGNQKYAEAEPFLLEGYEGMRQNELADHPGMSKRMNEVAGWIVRLHEATDQPEKARAWREKLKATQPGAASTSVK